MVENQETYHVIRYCLLLHFSSPLGPSLRASHHLVATENQGMVRKREDSCPPFSNIHF